MRSIRILEPARRDLVAGYRFYEGQAEGIGRYFLTVWKLSVGALDAGVCSMGCVDFGGGRR